MGNTLTGLAWTVGLAIIGGGLYWATTAGSRKRLREFHETWAAAREIGNANTKALEENTSALRDLIAKIDQTKG